MKLKQSLYKDHFVDTKTASVSLSPSVGTKEKEQTHLYVSGTWHS
jgi:hypothetical protein